MRPEDGLLDVEVARRKFREAELLHERRAELRTIGWEVRQPHFPRVEVFFLSGERRRIGVRLGLRNYDFLPASVVYLSPAGALFQGPIPAAAFPQPNGPPMARIVQQDGHPLTKLPFLCVEGTWEFHTHIQHQHRRWDDYRGSITLTDVVAAAFDAVDQGWLRS